MVWGAISARGKTKLVVVAKKVDAGKYIEVLEDALVPYLEYKFGADGEGVMFQ